MSKLVINKVDILIVLNILSYIIRYFTDIDLVYGLAIITFCGCITCLYCLFNYRYLRKLIVFIIVLNLISSINIFFNTNISIFMPAFTFSLEMMGILLFSNKDNLRVANVCALLIYIYLCANVISDYVLGNAIQISLLCGKNTVSILLIYMLGLHLIYCNNSKKKMHTSLFIVAFVIVFLCSGSGGILSFAIFTAGILMFNSKKIKLSPLKVIIMLIVGVSFVIMNIETIMQMLADDNSRFWIWSHYKDLAFATTDNFWFGADVSVNWILEKYANMHNTFINFHYMYGLIPFIVYNVIIVLEGIYFLKNRKFIMLVLWGVMLVRGFTDAAEFAFAPIWTYMLCQMMYDNTDKYKC